jgi:hypothetical protein
VTGPFVRRLRRLASSVAQWSRTQWIELATVFAAASLTVACALIPAQSEGAEPLQFRRSESPLSKLPVVISDVRSCVCWSGPRDQAQKLFKMEILNQSEEVVSLTSGEKSEVRLLVGYREDFLPHVTVPDENADTTTIPNGSNDFYINQVERFADAEAIPVNEDVHYFSLPPGYKVWAVPPTPNFTAEKYGTDKVSHATIVEQDNLVPGEQFKDARKSHGIWVFNIPLPPGFRETLLHQTGGVDLRSSDEPIILDRSFIRHNVAILGIAVISRTEEGAAPNIVGFAPAPPDTELVTPDAL